MPYPLGNVAGSIAGTAIRQFPLPSAQGDYVTPQMFGAKANGSTNDQPAIASAIATGKPVFFPVGSYLSSLITLPSDCEIFGTIGSQITSNTADGTLFFGSGKSNIHIHNLELIGANGALKVAESAAITLVNCTDFHIHDLDCTNWPAQGVNLTGTSSTNTLCKDGVVERVKVRSGQTPCRFTSAGVHIGEHTENITVRDCDISDMNAGIIIINPSPGNHYYLRHHRVLYNRIQDCAQYGIIVYGASTAVNVTNAANNGSGVIRITATAHGLATDDQVNVQSVTGTTEANGNWKADVINANTVDLRGSVFTNAWVSGGTIRRITPTDILIHGNIVDGIDGSPTATNGSNGNFGAGIYTVDVGAIVISKNQIRNTNLGTTSASLAPAGIGISGSYGDVLVSGNTVEDCEWYGILNTSGPYGDVSIVGNKVRRNKKDGIRNFDAGEGTVGDNVVISRKGVTGSPGIVVDATTATQRIAVTGNRIRVNGSTRPLSISKATGGTVSGNIVSNDALAAVTCEVGYFNGCSRLEITGNVFDGGLSANPALSIVDCTSTVVSGNISRMTDSVSARPCVTMSGTCTGTVYDRSNQNSIGRMENTSTGGVMHTVDTVTTSGGKTRQVNDTVQNTAAATTGIHEWTCIAAGNPGTFVPTSVTMFAPLVVTTGVGNVLTGEDNLCTASIPANALYAAGRAVRITAWGTTANNANAKTLRLYFGSLAIFSRSMTTSIAGHWRIEARVVSTGTDAQDYAILSAIDETTAVAPSFGTATQDDGAAITVKCTGDATATNDIVQEGLLVEFIN